MKITLLTIFVLLMAFISAQEERKWEKKKPKEWLDYMFNRFNQRFDVYTDADAAGNHFVCKGKVFSDGDDDAIDMNEQSTDSPYKGINCIKATFRNKKNNNWGGVAFLNGVLEGDETQPKANWGTYPKAGINLSGATTLTFYARSETGTNPEVEFYCFGQGAGNPYPDSAKRRSSGYIRLTPEWQKVVISVSGSNMGYIICGFGWVTNSTKNPKGATFYLDEISFNKASTTAPRFCLSFETIQSEEKFDTVMRNCAFLYDNAMLLLAYLAVKDYSKAKLIADAMVYTFSHDRYYTDGRLRNGYQAGDLKLPPGWNPNDKTFTVRMPGWYDPDGTWYEDEFQVSSHTGNLAWTMISLLAYYEIRGKNASDGKKYLNTAISLGDWIENNCKSEGSSPTKGYTGGYEGWEKRANNLKAPDKLTFKSQEHNIDLYAAFHRLYLITQDNKWKERADHALFFVKAMWNSTEKHFWTGTKTDGETINTDAIPLDVQAWAILALGKEESKPYWDALKYADSKIKVNQGYDFSYLPTEPNDGIWFEGTSQVACTYFYIGQEFKCDEILNFVLDNSFPSGAIPAASIDGLTTGYDLPNGDPWLYYKRGHVGATAWYLLAKQKVNPFWLGRDY